MKDVLIMKSGYAEYSKDIYEKLYNNLLTAKDRKKLETQDIQIIVDFKKLTPMKTLKQLGYIYAEVYFKAWLGYMIFDGVKYDMDETIGKLKIACGLAYQSGVPKSLAKANIDEASSFIERAVLFINENLPVTCEDSKTWKEKKRNRV